MKCKKVEKLLSGYLDNPQWDTLRGVPSLKETRRDEIKQHIAECGNCREGLNIMKKVDSLVKLKTKEKPSKKYWENYWTRLERKLINADSPGFAEDKKLSNFFIPKFSPAFSGVLIALLIFVNSLLYINIQQLSSLQTILSERQEQMQKEISRYLTKLDGSVIIGKNNFK